MNTFENELRELIKRYGYDVNSNVPDYVIVDFLTKSLGAYLSCTGECDIRRKEIANDDTDLEERTTPVKSSRDEDWLW